MELELVEILQGSFSSIFAIITTIVGIRIALRYFESKNGEFLLVGISWVGIASIWYPDLISFIMILLFNTPLNETVYFIIMLAFVPIALILWLIAWTNLAYKEKQKIVLTLAIIFALIYEIIFWSLLFTDISLVGTFLGPFQVEITLIFVLLAIFVIIIFLITGIIFSWYSIKSDVPEHKLRGKFLMIAVISFVIGAAIDASFPYSALIVVITRLILITSSVEFYLAFNLPEGIKKRLLK